MSLLRPKNDPVRVFGRRLVTAGLLALFVLAASAAWSAYRKERDSSALRAQAELELSDLSAREAELTSDIQKLTTDRGKEETLRENYTLAGKGEGLIIIVDQSPAPVVHATSSILDWFGKAFSWW